MKRFLALFLLLTTLFAFTGCELLEAIIEVAAELETIETETEALPPETEPDTEKQDTDPIPLLPETAPGETEKEETLPHETSPPETEAPLPDKNGYFYDAVSVIQYIEAYGTLPPNYITKSEAGELGWEGGSVERYQDGAAIGGDTFGNREGILPTSKGRKYTECDLETNGKSARGAKRLIFSNDGLYFVTEDHYESFKEYIIDETGEAVPNGKLYS